MRTIYRAFPGSRTHKKSEELKRLRAKYPFRLVIDKSRSPKPLQVDTGAYGHFGYMPMRDGNEWLFLTAEARDKFIADYGGTSLG